MKRILHSLVIGITLLIVIPAWAQTVPVCPCSLEWTGNTEPDMSHYNLYYSQVEGQFPSPGQSVWRERINHPANRATDVEITLNLVPGQWWFALTAVDISENESPKTANTVTVIVPPDTTAPDVPVNFRVIIP